MKHEFPEGFEWHPKKAQANLEKHGVDFWDVVSLFEDPLSRYLGSEYDPENNEDREKIAAYIEGVVIVVAYTERGEKTRIISARRATRKERKQYEEER